MANKTEEFVDNVGTIKMGVSALGGLYDKGIDRFVKGQKSALKGKSSVIGMAAKNTFEFPVFISKSVPLDYATATCTLLEQVYASYIQMAISMNPIVDARALKDISGGGGYLSRFKTNTTKYVEYTDASYAHDACHNVITYDDVITEFDMLSIDDELSDLISEYCSYEPLSEFNHFFMEADKNGRMTHDEFVAHQKDLLFDARREKYIKYYHRAPSASEEKSWHAQISREVETKWSEYDKLQEELHQLKMKNQEVQDVHEGKSDPKRNLTKAQIDNLNKQTDSYKKQIEKINKEIKKLEREESSVAANDFDKVRLDIDKKTGELVQYRQFTADEELYDRRRKIHNDAEKSKYDTAIAKKDAENYDERLQNERNREARERMAKAPEIMDETKIRKLNSLKPLMMRCQIRVSDKTGRITEYPVELICGVKVHCRMIDASVLPNVVKFPLKEMDQLTRKIRFRAGELKFFKDVVFNIKEKKQTAIDSRDPNHKWYRRLYQLAHMKGDSIVSQRISGNGSSGLIPNAALIITNNDVENVKAETDIDVLKGSVGCKLCKELFMMALIVIDQDQESVKMLTPDINSDYEVHSMASINKQLAELDTAGTKTRDIFKLLG